MSVGVFGREAASAINLDLGRIPTLHVIGESIPQAYFKAIKEVWERGFEIRTEYDRRDDVGKYIDPASRDARVLIEVINPFAEPRFPPISFCEIGVYIAEMLGLKDYKVLPLDRLLLKAAGGGENAQEWPYTYPQRLRKYPCGGGHFVDQIELTLDRVAKTPFTRRAVATTSLPGIDPMLKEDVPCLREIQLRCPEKLNGRLALNMNTTWRSRDLYKAWGDNTLAVTFLQREWAKEIAEKAGRKVNVGSYADYSGSLHIYGQDFGAVGGDSDKGLQSFFDTFTEQSFMERSLTSEMARDMLVLPQLQKLLQPDQIEQWGFPPESVELLKRLVDRFSEGELP